MSGVSVSVETSTENQVVEVSYDGQEIVQPILTLNEHLSKQTSKINFDNLDDYDIDKLNKSSSYEDCDAKQNDSTLSISEDERIWPWESLRQNLRAALTEMSVLSDVVTICNHNFGRDADGNPRRYMVLDGPVQAQPSSDSRLIVSLMARKKSLDAPAKILTQGAKQLQNLLQNETKSSRGFQDFHVELLRLRQNWRLKKVSKTILGDLSYRTAGSRFKQSGVFEVSKADDEEEGSNSISDSPDSKTSLKSKSAFRVTVPSELEGLAYIEVTIQKESDNIVSTNLSNFGAFGNTSQDVHWQKKLEAAQNVLFCKELFSQLAKEAVSLRAPIPHLVVTDRITASLFSDIQLIISLCHSNGADESVASVSETGGNSNISGGMGNMNSGVGGGPFHSQRNHSHVLEHSLHQLLRMSHSRSINPDGRSLSTTQSGIPVKRRMAAPACADVHTLLKMSQTPTLLEQIIQHAQHVVLRLRTMFVLDTMARELKDPLITCHWSTLSSPTRTSVKVNIITTGYDSIFRTQLVIHVGEKQLTVICKDGRVFHFSHEPQELRDFILCQLSQHQINGVQSLAKMMGWQVLSSSIYLGCGQVEPLGNAAGCVLSNAKGDRLVAVRHSPQSTTTVFVAATPYNDKLCSSVYATHVKSTKDSYLPGCFRELRLDKMDGKNLLNKLEYLLAVCADPQNSMM